MPFAPSFLKAPALANRLVCKYDDQSMRAKSHGRGGGAIELQELTFGTESFEGLFRRQPFTVSNVVVCHVHIFVLKGRVTLPDRGEIRRRCFDATRFPVRLKPGVSPLALSTVALRRAPP